MPKVIVGMSGGVDSAVAAYLLKKAGHDVIGVTLRVWEAADGTEGRCCEIDDARRTAWKLDIPYYPVNCLAGFKKYVTEPFISDYIRGLTPNPCIECNRHVKWERMLYFAQVFGADYIATGHYASVVRLANGRYTVKSALHAEKDQTYMLYKLTQEQLSKTLMPLGNLSKDEVRQIARDAGLSVSEKEESQEICFVTDGDYAEYIEQNTAELLPGEGKFIDNDGTVLGTHKGIFRYTVGQRRGLGLPLGYPAYIKQIRSRTNEIVVAREEQLYSRTIICRDLNFLSIPELKDDEELICHAKIRYHHAGQRARIRMKDPGRVEIVFDEPVRAAAPGQSAVFYDKKGCVIGGGIISEVAFEK